MSRAGEPVANRAMITLSVMLATVMQVIDTTIANVALPHMQGALSATQDQISWVLTSYIVAAAIATPLTGWVSERFGRKRVFLWSIAGFTTASLMCGAAGSLNQMVMFRLLQGLFGAALVPLSQSVLLDAYPRQRHGQAMALWGVGIMVGPILGPTLGGILTESYNWRWVFYINLPVGVLAFLGVLTFVHEIAATRFRPFDFFGFAMLALAVGALQLLLDRGVGLDWFSSMEIRFEAVVSGLCFYLLLVQVLTAEHPFIDREALADRNLVTGLIFIFVVGIILLATLALLPPLLQHLLNYPVVTTGMLLSPRGVGTMVTMLIVGRLVSRIDPRLLILVGLLLLALSLWQMSHFSLDVGYWEIIETGVVQGLGLGLIFVPLSTIAFATLAPHLRTEGAAMFSLLRNLGSSVGISIVIAVLTNSTQINHATMTEHITPFGPRLAALPQAWNIHSEAGLAALNMEVTRQAAMIGYLNDFRLMLYVVLGAIPLLLLLRAPRRSAASPAAAAAAD